MAGIEFFGNYEVQDASGVDLTTLRRNLTLSLEDRLENNRRAAEAFEALRATLGGQDSTQRRRLFMLDIPGLIRKLKQFQVEFVVIGGVAMVAQGSNHSTRDVDICYNRSGENLTRVSAALTDLHAYLRGAPGLPFRTDVPTLQAGLNFTLETDCGDLDLIGEVAGVGGYPEVMAAAEEREMFGERVRVLSLDGLIASKRAAGRAKDQSHLLELEALKKLRDAGQ